MRRDRGLHASPCSIGGVFQKEQSTLLGAIVALQGAHCVVEQLSGVVVGVRELKNVALSGLCPLSTDSEKLRVLFCQGFSRQYGWLFCRRRQ